MFCPLIFEMLEQKNKKKFKPFMIYSFLEFLSFREKLKVRLVCKLFNKCTYTKLSFLRNQNFIAMNKSWLEEVKNRYDNSQKKYKTKPSRNSLEKVVTFDSSGGKFSKKNTLIKLINGKNYMNIKKQVSLGRMLQPKQLCE